MGRKKDTRKRILVRISDMDIDYLKRMSGITGWSSVGVGIARLIEASLADKAHTMAYMEKLGHERDIRLRFMPRK